MQFRPTADSVTFNFVPTTRFSPRRLIGASLAVAALGLGLAACGGGDDEEPATTATTVTGPTETAAITQDELIRQGDQICAEANSAIGAIESSTADETTSSSQISDIYDGIAQQLGALGTPSDGDPPTDVIAAAQELADGSTDTTALQTAADEYGFTECSDAPETTSYPSTDSTGTDSSSTESSTETYTPPVTETAPEPVAPPTTTPTTPSTGGGVAPTPPATGGGTSTGGSSGGASSGGIGPG
jgi:hypothetical protein